MPGLKGVTNFFAGSLRIGVPLIGAGVERIGLEVFTAPENELVNLGSLVGVRATVLKRGGVPCGLTEFLEPTGSRRGGLKDFVAAFPLIPETDGV
jgi:hypothetical protein